jgi:hypothetical protein
MQLLGELLDALLVLGAALRELVVLVLEVLDLLEELGVERTQLVVQVGVLCLQLCQALLEVSHRPGRLRRAVAGATCTTTAAMNGPMCCGLPSATAVMELLPAQGPAGGDAAGCCVQHTRLLL